MGRLIVALTIAALLAAAMWDSFFVGFFNDDAMYIALARSLAAGTGYTDIMAWGAPPHLKYPPGFPLLLAPLQALWPDSFAPLKLVGVMCALAAVALTFSLLADAPAVIRWGATLLLACNPFLARYASSVLSDFPFLCLALAYLLAARAVLGPSMVEPRQSGTASPPLWACAALAAIAALAFYVRTTGMCLALSTVLLLAWRRAGWRSIAVYAALFAVLVLPLFLRQGHLGYQGDVVLHYEAAPAWTIPAANLRLYLAALPLAILADPMRWTPRLLGPSPDILLWLACVATWAAILVGFVTREGSRPGLAGILCVLYGAMIVLWPYTDVRFFIPLFPLLIAYFLGGAAVIARRMGGGDRVLAWGVPAVACVLVLCSALTLARPVAEERCAPLAAYDWLRAHTKSGDPVITVAGAVWLYTGRPIVLLPPWPGAPEKAVFDVVNSPADWMLLRGDGASDAAPPQWAGLVDARPSLFQLMYDNPGERVRIFRISGERRRFLAAYDLFVRGVGELQRGNWEEGGRLLDACLQREPDFPPAQFDRAIAFRQMGLFAEEERALERLVARHPDHARARRRLEEIRAERPAAPAPP